MMPSQGAHQLPRAREEDHARQCFWFCPPARRGATDSPPHSIPSSNPTPALRAARFAASRAVHVVGQAGQTSSPRTETKGTAMQGRSRLTIVMMAAVLAVGGAVVDAQNKYSLKSPDGIAFADFKGYEDWAVVSSARTDEVLKVIVANPTIIAAYKAGVPGKGRAFPDGSKIVKLRGSPRRAPRPRSSWTCRTSSRKRSSSRRTARGFGRAAEGRLRTLVPFGCEGEGLHLSPVPEALKRARQRWFLFSAGSLADSK
jgi:hypothetical protein